MPRERMTLTSAVGGRNRGCMNILSYGIIRAASQARKHLQNGNLEAQEVTECLRMLRVGRQCLARLERRDVDIGDIDLSDPPTAAAAPPHIQRKQAAGGNPLDQDGRR